MKWELADPARLTGRQAPRILLPPPPSAGITVLHSIVLFCLIFLNMDAGELNASLHIYKVKILLTEPSPQSL